MKLKKGTWVVYIGTDTNATLCQVMKSSKRDAKVWLADGSIGVFAQDDLVAIKSANRTTRAWDEHEFKIEPNLHNTAATLTGNVFVPDFVGMSATGPTPETLSKLSISVHGLNLEGSNQEIFMIEFGHNRAHLQDGHVPAWLMGLVETAGLARLVAVDQIEPAVGSSAEVIDHKITTKGSIVHHIVFPANPRLRLLDQHETVEFAPDSLTVTETGSDFYGDLKMSVRAQGDDGDTRATEFLTDDIPDWVTRIFRAGVDLAAMPTEERNRSATPNP